MCRTRMCRIVVAGLFLPALWGGLLFAEENPPAPGASTEEAPRWFVEAGLTYSSKYVWRGLNVVDGSVAQPSLTMGRGGFSVNLWSNLDLTDENGQSGDLTEIDLTADYSGSWRGLDWSVGAIYYTFPHGPAGASTTELYAGLAAPAVPLSPALTVYKDVDEAGGAYARFSVGHSLERLWRPAQGASVGLELGGSLAYGTSDYVDFYYGTGGGSLTDAMLSVSAPISLGNGWSAAPFLNYSRLVDSDIRDAKRNDDNLWGGLTLTRSF